MYMLERLALRRRGSTDALAQRLSRAGGLLRQTVQQSNGGWVRLDGRWVVNFAGANFLGFNCRQDQSGYDSTCVSLGMPALLGESPLARQVERGVARLVGQQAAMLFPSTTHAALDLLPLLAGAGGTIFLDESAYPISEQGAAAAMAAGVRTVRFRHNDPADLAARMAVSKGGKVIVCDGVYPLEGRLAALSAFNQLARRFEASLYVDDAHGIGVLGSAPSARCLWGSGGGGSPAFAGLPPGNLVHVGSLTKAFGAQLAFAAGPEVFIELLRQRAGSVAHSGPPSPAALRAALQALYLNKRQGDVRRARLQGNIRLFRQYLKRSGCQPRGLAPIDSPSILPVQSLHFSTAQGALNSALHLRRQGFWVLLQLQSLDHPQGGTLRFVFSAAHTARQIQALAACLAGLPQASHTFQA